MNNSYGVRFLGKTWFGLDFSLNYIHIPITWGDGRFFPANQQLAVYGNAPFNGVAPVGTFQQGLEQCLSPSGKSSTRTSPAPAATVVLMGADLRGYDWPERRLDSKGNPLPSAKQKQAARAPYTFCAYGPKHTIRETDIIGFTSTYNDFDYTGAIIRLEQSLSTREGMNRYPAGYGKTFGVAGTGSLNGGKRTLFHEQAAWRSMVGFDLLSAFQNYRLLGWTRNLPGNLGQVPFFLSFQWLMLYYPATSNNFCNYNNAVGIGPSNPSEGPPARPAQSGCKNNHWNHFLTLGGGQQGIFGGKMEQRLAMAFEPRGQQWLLYGQWWWRDFLNLPIDLSGGISWLPNSRFNNSWTAINYFVGRNLLWFETTYYLL
jgi:hypothetical protein